MMCYVREVGPENFPVVLPLIKKLFPAAHITVSQDDLFFVAIYGSKIVGFLHMSEYDDRYVLKGIGVDDDYRNSGNGSMLMEKVEEISAVSEKRIYLKVKATNPALLLYERFGFTLHRFGAICTLVKRPCN
ncbi:MAG: GNAT family N-acetyltransferase [Candidatus Micrarchaeota archaeon]